MIYFFPGQLEEKGVGGVSICLFPPPSHLDAAPRKKKIKSQTARGGGGKLRPQNTDVGPKSSYPPSGAWSLETLSFQVYVASCSKAETCRKSLSLCSQTPEFVFLCPVEFYATFRMGDSFETHAPMWKIYCRFSTGGV